MLSNYYSIPYCYLITFKCICCLLQLLMMKLSFDVSNLTFFEQLLIVLDFLTIDSEHVY